MTTVVDKDVEVTRVVEPRFLTLTGKPANQIAFKVIRDDNGETTMTAPMIQRKRTKRSEALLSITFDEDTSEEEVKAKLSEWGIENYEIETTADGKKKAKCAQRSDAASPTMDVRLGDNIVATVLKPISNSASDKKIGLRVVRIDFDADYFETTEQVSEWLTKKRIDFSETDVENSDQAITVRRHAVEENAELRKVTVDDGVHFVVIREDEEESDIPDEYVSVINDTAYGRWGWGQLDFAAALADVEFCSYTEQALYYLNSVLDDIIFYSDLPVNLRKDLIKSTLTQFGDYVVALLDALPARVVVANRSIHEKEKVMSKKEVDQSGTPETDAATTDTAGTDTGAAAEEGTISRADVATMIGEAVTGLAAQIADLKAALPAAPAKDDGDDAARRSDGTSGDDDTSKPDANTEALQAIMRSVQELTTAVGGMGDRVQSLESSTVVRSDEGDGKQVERKDVFQGMFGGKAKA